MDKLKVLNDKGLIVNEGLYSSFNYDYEKYLIRTREHNIYESEEYFFINDKYYIDIHIYHYKYKDVYGLFFLDLFTNEKELIYNTKHHFKNSIILYDNPLINNEIEINKKNLYFRITRLSKEIDIMIKRNNKQIFYASIDKSSLYDKYSSNNCFNIDKHMFLLKYNEFYNNSLIKYKNINTNSYVIYEYTRSYLPKEIVISSSFMLDKNITYKLEYNSILKDIKHTYNLDNNVMSVGYSNNNDTINIIKETKFRR